MTQQAPTSHSDTRSISEIRKATFDDAELLLNWRNDEVTRMQAFTQDIIKPDDHRQWLERTLGDPKKVLQIILNEQSEPIGQVRFDISGTVAEITIALGPEYRNRGYGTLALIESSTRFMEHHPEVRRIRARIKETNEVSIKVFKRAGYGDERRDKGVVSLFFAGRKKD